MYCVEGFWLWCVGGVFWRWFVVGFVVHHLLDEGGDGAEVGLGWEDLGDGGEEAVDGVEGDLFDGVGFSWGWGWFGGGVAARVWLGLWFFGKGGVGDLEAVEEQAGAFGVDVVVGDALEDFADGVQDGGAVFEEREVEGGAAAATLLWLGYRFSGGVVVVAELFVAEAGAGAAVAAGEDVAALIVPGGGLGCGVGCGVAGVVHVFPPPLGRIGAKSSKEKTCVRTSPGAGPDLIASIPSVAKATLTQC